MTREEFYEKIEQWISDDKSKWNHITLMAYFFHKYEQKNGVRYIPSRWKGEPALSKESKDFSRLVNMFKPDNFESLPKEQRDQIKFDVHQKVYNYINWCFDYKFRTNLKALTGTGLMLVPHIINEFEIMYNKQLKKAKQNNTLEIILQWCRSEVPDILDNHQLDRLEDLKSIERYVECYSLDQSTSEYKLVQKAKSMGVL